MCTVLHEPHLADAVHLVQVAVCTQASHERCSAQRRHGLLYELSLAVAQGTLGPYGACTA
jgi:hypothetical protein